MIKILQGLENNLSSQKVWNKKLFSKLTRKISHQAGSTKGFKYILKLTRKKQF